MKRIDYVLPIFFLLIFLPSLSRADEIRPINPFDGVKDIALEVLIGNTLHGHSGKRIFDDDSDKRQQLEDHIENLTRRILDENKIAVSPQASHRLHVGVFGRQVDNLPDCPDLYVFLIDCDVFSESREDNAPNLFDDFILIIGVATKDELINQISDELSDRLRYELKGRLVP